MTPLQLALSVGLHLLNAVIGWGLVYALLVLVGLVIGGAHSALRRTQDALHLRRTKDEAPA